MICPSCKSVVNDTSKFCSRCGAKLEGTAVTPENSASTGNSSVHAPSDKPLTAAERRKNFFSSIGKETAAEAPTTPQAEPASTAPEPPEAAPETPVADLPEAAPDASFWDNAPVIQSLKDTSPTESTTINTADIGTGDTPAAKPEPPPTPEPIPTPQDGIEVESIPDSDIEVIPLSADGSPGFEIPEPQEEPVDKRKPLNAPVVLVCALLTLCFLGGAYYIFHNRDGNLQDLYAMPAFAPAQSDDPAVIENLFIPESEITLYQGQNKQVSFEVYPENADTSQLQWSSTGGGVSVNEAGRITGLEAGYEGEISLSDASGTITAVSKVRVLTPDDALFETIDWIANKTDNQIIDLNAQHFKPKKIDPALAKVEKHEDRRAWGYQQFAQINDEISKYTVVQKQLVSIDTKNKIDCDIYMDTEKNEIRKIVAIEYYPNNLDITDYYYTDGKLCFLFNRRENYYRPVPANWGIPGSRLYFQDDAMTTWRETTKTGEDYTKIDYSYGSDGFEWDVTTYNYDLVTNVISNQADTLSLTGEGESERTDKEKAYLALEEKSINNAYNIYNKLNELPEITAISGHVLDAAGAPIAHASVKVFSEELGMLVSNAYTDETGAYSVDVPASALAYTAVVADDANGKREAVSVHNVHANAEASHNYQQAVYLFEASTDTLPIRIDLLDALSGQPVALPQTGATLNVRPGINNKSGGPVQTFSLMPPVVTPSEVPATDAEPAEAAPAAPLPEDTEAALAQNYEIALTPGNYTGELVLPGYETCYFSIVTLRPNWTVQAVLMPEITDDGLRVVLNWSGSPADLDAHLFTPTDGHVAFNSTAGDDTLTADKTDGYGPETILLAKAAAGTYKYYVSDYTNLKQENYLSDAMANSGAVVSVYSANGLLESFYVPRGEKGVIWHVFNISNGRIVPVQRYFNNIEDVQWWNTDK